MYNFSINIRDTTIGLPHGSIILFEFVGKKYHISLHISKASYLNIINFQTRDASSFTELMSPIHLS